MDTLLLGRHRELAEIERLLTAALAGRGATILVTGEAGIGKSTVLAEALFRARERGVPTAVGRATSDDDAPALWPWSHLVATTQTMPVIASGGYLLDPTASEVAITARGAFGARVQASIDLVDVRVDVAGDPSASRAQATFDMSSFESGNGRRDKDIRNRFFRADENPTMRFTSTELQVGADGGWELGGRLEYRAACDVTLALSMVEADEHGIRARGTATVDRYACGVTKGRGLVGRWVDVMISVRLCRV